MDKRKKKKLRKEKQAPPQARPQCVLAQRATSLSQLAFCSARRAPQSGWEAPASWNSAHWNCWCRRRAGAHRIASHGMLPSRRVSQPAAASKTMVVVMATMMKSPAWSGNLSHCAAIHPSTRPPRGRAPSPPVIHMSRTLRVCVWECGGGRRGKRSGKTKERTRLHFVRGQLHCCMDPQAEAHVVAFTCFSIRHAIIEWPGWIDGWMKSPTTMAARPENPPATVDTDLQRVWPRLVGVCLVTENQKKGAGRTYVLECKFCRRACGPIPPTTPTPPSPCSLVLAVSLPNLSFFATLAPPPPPDADRTLGWLLEATMMTTFFVLRFFLSFCRPYPSSSPSSSPVSPPPSA